VLASKHAGFRPIDVRTGPRMARFTSPTGNNPIIQHGEVDFRDPRRDMCMGASGGFTAKGRPAE